MSQKTYLSPVDWDRFERIRAALDATSDAEGLAARLARESYRVEETDHLAVETLSEGGAITRLRPSEMLMALRAAPARFAMLAAELLRASGEEEARAIIAELAKAEDPYLLFDPQYLLLAYVSPAYCRAFMGGATIESHLAPYDGPEFIAAALGGARWPDTPYRAVNTPNEVVRISTALEEFDPHNCRNPERPRLLDYFEEHFGSASDIGEIAEEQVETLCRAYAACASADQGILIELH